MNGCIDEVMSSNLLPLIMQWSTSEFVIYRYQGFKGSSGVAERWKHWG